MSAKETGGPAYPHTVMGDLGQTREVCEGMTLRDWFAGKALNGMLTDLPSACHGYDWRKLVVEEAYKLADLMILERSK